MKYFCISEATAFYLQKYIVYRKRKIFYGAGKFSDLIDVMKKHKQMEIEIAGHTDNVGSDAANLRLSKDRAESVKAYLVGQGANASRIEATGYGMTQPIATNKTKAGRQKNRRVEFTIY